MESGASHNLKIVVGPYKPCRYLCPVCSERFGDPEPHGYIDVVRCKKCPTYAQQVLTQNMKSNAKAKFNLGTRAGGGA